MSTKKVALVVAHPDDETIWAGGTLLSHLEWQCYIVCLCRGKDKDRAPKFLKALEVLRSDGIMGNLDDGPDQKPLPDKHVEQTILQLLPAKHFDLVISHNPDGEYTKHLRHEETGKAIIRLWHAGKISTNCLWTFAYEDGQGEYYPRPVSNATKILSLTKRIWLRKYRIITETYGFEASSFEAQTTPRSESFWQFNNSHDAIMWLNGKENVK